MKNDRILSGFTPMLALLALVATYGGLFLPDLYQDGPYWRTQLYGQDFVTLLIGIPALLLAGWYALKKGSPRARLVLAGVLAYFAYVYAFFGFATAFNDFYLIQVGVFSLATFGLIFQMGQLTPARIRVRPERNRVFRTSSLYLLFVCAMIGSIWLIDIFSHIFVPGHRSATPTGEPALIVYTLDLAFVIPVCVYAAIALWRRQFWGYVLTGVMLVKTTILGLSLLAMTLSLVVYDLETDLLLSGIWLFISLAGLTLTVLFLRQLEIKRCLQGGTEKEEELLKETVG